MPGPCPCSRNDNGESAIALIACIALILVINFLWRRWSTMSTRLRGAAGVGLALLVVGSVAYVRSLATPQAGDGCAPVADGTAISATQPNTTTATTQAGEGEALPRIVDLGAKTCIPCRKMAPILEALRTELAGKARVEFIDITEDRKAAARFGVRVMPTQVFFDRDGKETWRHEGFLPKEDILARLRDAGTR